MKQEMISKKIANQLVTIRWKQFLSGDKVLACKDILLDR